MIQVALIQLQIRSYSALERNNGHLSVTFLVFSLSKYTEFSSWVLNSFGSFSNGTLSASDSGWLSRVTAATFPADTKALQCTSPSASTAPISLALRIKQPATAFFLLTEI